MRYARVAISESISFAEILRNLPKEPRGILAEGYREYGSAPHEIRERALAVTPEALDASSTRGSRLEIASAMGVGEEAAAKLFSAVSFTMSVAEVLDVTAEQFADDVVGAFKLPVEARPAILELGKTALARKPAWIENSRRAELAGEHLPQLEYFGTSIDLRIAFDEGRPSIAVPVLIAQVETDEKMRSLFFQMTARQVDDLVAELKLVAERLKKTQELASLITSKKS
jgi:hypothetical protein